MPAVSLPIPNETQTDVDIALPHFECSNNSRISACTILFLFFVLVFYALALWDRWLNLKLRESQKLRLDTQRVYGATHSRSELTRPPPAANTEVDNGKASRNHKASHKSSSHLTPPSG
ncbi:hypothetical protein C8R43DRAFT_985705 [Mycena crocata]|nr:hypothetical protein C8R43DRAFT_985705 [Mycena crocata]